MTQVYKPDPNFGRSLEYVPKARLEALGDEVARLTAALLLIANYPYGGAPDIHMRKIARTALGETQ